MNKSDKYYLKQGKLELSMLDDEEDDGVLKNSRETSSKRELFADLEFPHTKRLKEDRMKPSRTKESKLKVTQDIYNTLHTMGQFLAKADEGEVESTKVVQPKRNINTAKAQKLEQIASTLKIQELELPPREDNKDAISTVLEVEGVPFESLSDERLKEEITQDLPKQVQVNEEDRAATWTLKNEMNAEISEMLAEERELDNYSEVVVQARSKEQLKASSELEETFEQVAAEQETIILAEPQSEENAKISAIEKEIEQVYYGDKSSNEIENFKIEVKAEDPNKELKQGHIDEIIRDFFGNITPKYPFENELKRHIDRKSVV